MNRETVLAGGEPAVKTGRHRFKRLLRSPAWLNLMYVPVVLLFAVFVIYPFLKGLRISFTNWDGFSQSMKWIGWENYRRMWADPNMWTVLKNTLIYGVGSTILQNLVGLAYALLLNQSIKIRGITRTIVYLPVIISPLIMGYIWYFFFQFKGGALNDIVLLFQDKPLNLLANSTINVWIITLVNTYQYVGVAMVIYLAGLQAIPREYEEAAAIDGASAWLRFRHVTLPLLAPAITVNVVINLIGGLKLFDVIFSLTKGGPGYASQSLSTLMYKYYFASMDAGYAAAIGNLMFVIISVISIAALILLRRKEVTL